MTDLKQAAQQALEALGSGNPYHQQLAAKVLRTVLEQKAEPVTREGFNVWWNGDYDDSENRFEKDSAAYWAWAGWQAAQRQWVGLEIEEVQDSYNSDYQAQTRAVEKLLKERNI